MGILHSKRPARDPILISSTFSYCANLDKPQWSGEGKLWPLYDDNGVPVTTGGLFREQLYRFEQNTSNPLVLYFRGNLYSPSNCVTDLGSIPRPVQMIYPKDRWIRSYLLHDSGYITRGVLCGEYVPLVFKRQERKDIDDRLIPSILAEGGEVLDAHIIHWFVEKFGGPIWKKHDSEFKQ